MFSPVSKHIYDLGQFSYVVICKCCFTSCLTGQKRGIKDCARGGGGKKRGERGGKEGGGQGNKKGSSSRAPPQNTPEVLKYVLFGNLIIAFYLYGKKGDKGLCTGGGGGGAKRGGKEGGKKGEKETRKEAVLELHQIV